MALELFFFFFTFDPPKFFHPDYKLKRKKNSESKNNNDTKTLYVTFRSVVCLNTVSFISGTLKSTKF